MAGGDDEASLSQAWSWKSRVLLKLSGSSDACAIYLMAPFLSAWVACHRALQGHGRPEKLASTRTLQA